jgi:flagellar hook-associated protein 1 FlgK
VLSDLSKQVQVSVVKQGDSFNIFIGNGQPLVVNNLSFQLAPVASTTDLSRMEVGLVQPNGPPVQLGENSITGGALGGLFDFRSQSMDPAQNALGRIAIGLADTFNAQHMLGVDQNGAVGGTFFNAGSPVVSQSTLNTGTGTLSATIDNVSKLTTSDYRITYDGTNYTLTQLSDNSILYKGPDFTYPATVPPAAQLPSVQSMAESVGLSLDLTGTPNPGDSFMVKPTAAGATTFNVAITDPTKIAAAAPVRTALASFNSGSGLMSTGTVGPISITTGANTGTGQITGAAVDASYSTATLTPTPTLTYNAGVLTGFPATLPVSVTNNGVTTVYPAGSPVTYASGATISFGGANFVLSGAPANGDTFNVGKFIVAPTSTLTYNTGTNLLSGFPNNMPVTVTNNGTTTVYPAGTPVPYTADATISYGGVSFVLSGVPANGDQFNVGANSNGTGDNRNALLLGALQAANTLVNGTSSYQSAYGQLINAIGNKTRELEVTTAAADQQVTSAIQAQQEVSGVNLDEEAANLMRYQQAYQAAGKVMQTANKMFDVLLTLGG